MTVPSTDLGAMVRDFVQRVEEVMPRDPGPPLPSMTIAELCRHFHEVDASIAEIEALEKMPLPASRIAGDMESEVVERDGLAFQYLVALRAASPSTSEEADAIGLLAVWCG